MKMSKFAFIGVSIVVLVSCESSMASCWPALIDAHDRLSFEFDSETIDIRSVGKARKKLLVELSNCPPDTKFIGVKAEDQIASDWSYTLLDLAVMADDAELTRFFAEQLSGGGMYDPKTKLLYEGRFLQLGAYFESKNAVRELLELGFDPNDGEGHEGTALHEARVFTVDGLEVIRTLVIKGANLNSLTDREFTPIMHARNFGHLAKAQCLYSLGAKVPDLTDSSARLPIFVSPESVAGVTAFLADPNKEVPEYISKVCKL